MSTVEDMSNVSMYQVCGHTMPDVIDPAKACEEFDPPGHPRTCPDCQEDGDIE